MSLPSIFLSALLLLASTSAAATTETTLTTRNQHLFRYLFVDVYTATPVSYTHLTLPTKRIV